jgi:hypothetical protein
MGEHVGSDGFEAVDYYGDIPDTRNLDELPIKNPETTITSNIILQNCGRSRGIGRR